MTYKATSTTHNYLTRSGSHSITHSRRGDSSHLTNEVDVSYTIDSAVKEGIDDERNLQLKNFYTAQKMEIAAKLTAIGKQLSVTLPFEEFKKLNKKKAALAKEYTALEAELFALKKARRGRKIETAGCFEKAFLDTAARTLPKDLFKQLTDAARELLKREADTPPTEARDDE